MTCVTKYLFITFVTFFYKVVYGSLKIDVPVKWYMEGKKSYKTGNVFDTQSTQYKLKVTFDWCLKHTTLNKRETSYDKVPSRRDQ